MSWRTNERGLYIFIPDDEPPRFHCTVIVRHEDGENTICGTPFHDERQYLRHVTACARRHHDVIQKAAPSSRLPDWLTSKPVTDWEVWLSERDAAGVSNQQKVIEGRKKL